MSTIDIKKGYKHLTPEEIRSYAYSGIVYCGTTDLTDFLEYIFQGFEDEIYDKVKQEFESHWDEDDGGSM